MTYRVKNIAIAIGLALVAMLLTIFYVTNYKRSVESSVATVKVFVAANDVQAGIAGSDLIASHDLKLADMPRKSVVPGAITKPDQIRNLVLSAPLFAGEQVTLRRFTEVSADGVRAHLKGNMRAVQVAGDQNQVLSGTLQIGDRVDVVGNIKLGQDSSEHVVRIVLRDLEVLGIPSESVTTNVASGDKAVILAVSDVQVQRLFFLMKNADWTLQLRPVLEPTDSKERLETTDSILKRGIKK